ncbi:hypothetical protein [Nocardioides litoris]|uniref:hypothetical protein n=1 Tax=Nocardioides litoris TaxID=1926648 RepID=UPI00111DB52C|nr:hypothetical protein [Nocardioides litoris]
MPSTDLSRRSRPRLLGALTLAVATALTVLPVTSPTAHADVSGGSAQQRSDPRGDVRDVRGDARSVAVRTGRTYSTELRWYGSPQPAAKVYAQVWFRNNRTGAPTWQAYAVWNGSWTAGIYRSGDATRRCRANATWIDSKKGVRVTFAPGCVGRVLPGTVSGQSIAQLQYGTYVDKVNR